MITTKDLFTMLEATFISIEESGIKVDKIDTLTIMYRNWVDFIATVYNDKEPQKEFEKLKVARDLLDFRENTDCFKKHEISKKHLLLFTIGSVHYVNDNELIDDKTREGLIYGYLSLAANILAVHYKDRTLTNIAEGDSNNVVVDIYNKAVDMYNNLLTLKS